MIWDAAGCYYHPAPTRERLRNWLRQNRDRVAPAPPPAAEPEAKNARQ